MSLSVALSVASSGLAAVNAQLSVLSQNVANATTAGYATETIAQNALTAAGNGYGVTTGPAVAATDPQLQASVLAQGAEVSSQQVTSDALASLDQAQGTTGAGNDLASQLGSLTDSFTTLSADPSNVTEQASVVSAASTLAAGIQSQAAAYSTALQGAQDGLVSNVATLNSAIQSIGSLSQQIVAAKAIGQSSADLQTQLNVQEQTASQLAGVKFVSQQNGSVVAIVGGSQVELNGPAPGPFSMASATLSTGSTAPSLYLSGQDVTSQITTGSIGAQLTLRDTTIPTAQAGLDQFAYTLASRMNNQGLALFTDGAGNVPQAATSPAATQSTYLGFSSVIQVNSAVSKQPSLVRDGTQAVAGSATGASAFTPNPSVSAGGQAGFDTLINRVLTYGFGTEAQSGVPQPAASSTGLGVNGTISLSYDTGGTLADFASNLVSNQAAQAGNAQTALTNGQSLQSTLQSKLQTQTGVSVDTELSNMVVLQNSYGANARIIAAAQSMWQDLETAVTGSSS
jgi:flagellar hook-associated protein 1 FlgK